MQKYSWLAFCPGEPGLQSLLHLFPASRGTGAPYATECLIELFGNGQKGEQIVLEGVRMCQPDGLRLNDIFPVLNQQKGLYGIQITLKSDHGRTDLSASNCIIELQCRPHSVRFAAAPLDREDKRLHPGVAVQDSYSATSLVVVNGSTEEASFSSKRGKVMAEAQATGNATSLTQEAPSDKIGALSIEERKLDKTYFLQSSPREASWGMIHVESINADAMNDDCACFVLYRDSITKRPMSVCSL